MVVAHTAWDDGLKHAFGVLGTFTGYILYTSAIPVLLEIYRRKSTMQYSFIPYLLQWINCFCWVNYALHRGVINKLELLASAGGGLLMSSASLFVYWYYIVSRKRRWAFDLSVLGAVAVLITLAVLSFTLAPCELNFEKTWCWWKCVCIAANVAMYGGPTVAMYWSWKNRSVDMIPISLGMGSLLGCLPWLAYAIVAHDLAILLPNSVGMCVALAMVLEYRLIKCLWHRTADLELPATKSPTSTKSELVLNPWKQALFTFFYMDMYAVMRPRVEIELSDLSFAQSPSEKQFFSSASGKDAMDQQTDVPREQPGIQANVRDVIQSA